MNIFVERKCPICDDDKSRESIKPDLHPKDNLRKLEIIGEVFIRRNSFFLILDANVAFYIVRSIFHPIILINYIQVWVIIFIQVIQKLII